MTKKQLSEIIDLMEQGQGGKFVVFDGEGPSYVVMSVDEYKRVLDGSQDLSELSEKDLLENINRTIAEWRANQDNNEESYSLSEYREDEDNMATKDKSDLSYYYDVDDIEDIPF